jgi:hypothetical protein
VIFCVSVERDFEVNSEPFGLLFDFNLKNTMPSVDLHPRFDRTCCSLGSAEFSRRGFFNFDDILAFLSVNVCFFLLLSCPMDVHSVLLL